MFDPIEETITIIVNNVNRAPEITSLPVIEAQDGEQYNYDVEAIDSDGDTLIYSLTASPIDMKINSETGLISWVSPIEGEYDITAEVSDNNGGIDSQTYTLSVSPPPLEFIRGDANNDGNVNIADPIYILLYLNSNGSGFVCEDAADANDNGIISVADAYRIFNQLFGGVSQIAQPYPNPGFDTTDDELNC